MGALFQNFSTSYRTAAANEVGRQLRQFEQRAAHRPPGQGLRQFAVQFLQEGQLSPGGQAVVVSFVGSGLVVIGNTAPLVQDPGVSRWFHQPPARTQAFSTTLAGSPVEVVAAPLRSGDRAVGTYVAAEDLSPFVAERQRVLVISLVEAGIALLVGVASAYLLLRRLLRTVGRMTATAAGIGRGDLDQRLGEQPGNDEVGELAHTFDTMLDRLQAAMNSQRRLLADVSHQLRTPLTVARGHLEVLGRTGTGDPRAVRETLDLVIDELDHTTKLVERLLMLGRAMEPQLLALEPVDLAELLSSIAGSASVLAPRDIAVRCDSPLFVMADREQLRGAVVNLVDNAVHATPPGGRIVLGAHWGNGRPGPQGTTVAVEDSGPGIPEAQRAAALERFARPGAREEDGSGLGLAIAKEVAQAHGGSIWIDESPRLGGARVSLLLPASSLLPSGALPATSPLSAGTPLTASPLPPGLPASRDAGLPPLGEPPPPGPPPAVAAHPRPPATGGRLRTAP